MMDSLSSTLDMVAPLCLRKIRTLKRAACKMERSWRKTKLEVFLIAQWENTYPTEKL